ncbi:uroporphyrinogen-III synthase [Bacteroidales bacterium WCE2004]|jgi:uroporphyrinogen-III synthase|nr:uroporphyrinogen-III synthase [Bacteroidales bacterium WCE2004]
MKILISQQLPSNLAPYEILQSRFGAELDFQPFFLIEPLSAKEFRAEHINLPDYTAIVFSSRHAIDAYFKLSEEMRFKVPETMKYFCSTEAVAMYLQKHIVYRKRKIFFGSGSPASIVSLITAKHKGEKFLIATTEGSDITPITSLFAEARLDYTVGALVKPVSQDLHGVDLAGFDIAVLCNPADVASLHENFPEFKQGSLKFISFGKAVVKAMEESGLEIALKAPTPEATSISKAVELYLQSQK